MRSTKSSARSRIAEYGGLLPAAVLLGGLFGFALVLTVLYSFWQVVDFEVVPDWTLDNYRYFFSVDTTSARSWPPWRWSRSRRC